MSADPDVVWRTRASREVGHSTHRGTLFLTDDRLAFTRTRSARLVQRRFEPLDWQCPRDLVRSCRVDKGSLKGALLVGWSFYLGWPLLAVEITDGTRQRFLVRSPTKKAADLRSHLDAPQQGRAVDR